MFEIIFLIFSLFPFWNAYYPDSGYPGLIFLNILPFSSNFLSLHLLCFLENVVYFIFLNLFLFILFIFGCVRSSLLWVGFLQLRWVEATLHCGVQASHCSGFSCCRARALGAWTSVVAARGLSSWASQALELRLSSCGAQAQLFCGMWHLPGPGLKHVSPALAGGFLTTVPPAKSLILFINSCTEVLKKLACFKLDHFSFFSGILQMHYIPLLF